MVTVLSLNPDHIYDVVAINAASMSTQLSGLPFSGPIGGVRVAPIRGQWVAFPNNSDLEEAVFDMVVAGRVVGDDVAIMMVEAEATEKTIELIAGGATAPTEESSSLQVSMPRSPSLPSCARTVRTGGKSAKETGIPRLPRLPTRCVRRCRRSRHRRARQGAHDCRQAGSRSRVGCREGKRHREARRAVRRTRRSWVVLSRR